jgi:hypothetical protein
MHGHLRRLASILHGVIEQIAEDHFQQQTTRRQGQRSDFKSEHVVELVLMMQACGVGTLAKQIFQMNRFGFRLMTDGIKPSDLQQLIDQSIEPPQFRIHRLIKFLADPPHPARASAAYPGKA